MKWFLFCYCILFVSFTVVAQSTQTICDITIPPNTLESIPYSTKVTPMVANGKHVIGYIEYYRSIEYVQDCENKPNEVISSTILVF
ncbi:A-agglutinin-binding subunit [Nakaseomyces bracarensis]|uniref:A-agglutinin-binding subunit n=1 Tax=Nakaseomyces bracarensis TaxID=273131 RepID=A0ABR4NS71_9SACH